jgi:hypothetical protein
VSFLWQRRKEEREGKKGFCERKNNRVLRVFSEGKKRVVVRVLVKRTGILGFLWEEERGLLGFLWKEEVCLGFLCMCMWFSSLPALRC